MSNFGKNMRITIEESHRTLARALFTEALGCSVMSPRPDLDVFKLDDGFALGAYYVPNGEALSTADQMKSAWLELYVDDPDAGEHRLAELGIRPFEYFDKAHRYYCPPCGPVFRLAKRP